MSIATSEVFSTTEIIGKLSDTTWGIAMHSKKWRVRKALSNEQRAKMAEGFGAEVGSVSGTKKLIDTKNSTYRAVERIFDEAYEYWRFNTTPYPEHGRRLILKENLPRFRDEFRTYQNRMTLAVDDLERELPALIEQSQRSKLGNLFDRSDYPMSIEGLYELSFDVTDINPPSYLAQIDPELFREQMARANERIQHSIAMLEDEFLSELQKFIERLVNGLSKTDGGKRRALHENSISSLNSFFDRFTSLNLNSSGQLNSMVKRARDAMAGRKLNDLRTNDSVRDEVKSQLAELGKELDMVVQTRTSRQFEIGE